MARTQAADYDDRRLAILNHAAALYAKHGFLGASLGDLASECGISKSLIYHYYSSKEDILYDVMSSHIGALNAAADSVVAAGGSGAKVFRALARAFMHLYVGAADYHKVLLNERQHLPAGRRTTIIKGQRRLIEVVERLLEDAHAASGREKTLLRPRVMLFFGMINWTNTWFHVSGPATPDQIADLAVDLMLGKRSARS